MNKTDLAKMLGVDRCTVWRWEKEGTLKQKVDEHKQLSEFAKVNTGIEELKALQRIEELLKIISQKLIAKPIKDVAKDSKKVAGYKVLPGEKDYTAKELAAALGIDSRTVRRKILAGEIRAQKLEGKTGRYVIPGEEAQRIYKQGT